MTDYHGYHLYAFGSGSGAGDILFTFIDANTAAFGVRPAMEKMIDVRTGVSESLLTNDLLFPLINEANGTGIIWAVLDQSYTHIAVQQLLPQADQFPQAAAIINRMRAMTISVAADSGIDAQFQAVCDSTDDANLLAAALQAGVMYRRYQEAQDQPGPRQRPRSGERHSQRRSPQDRRARKPGSVVVVDSHARFCGADVVRRRQNRQASREGRAKPWISPGDSISQARWKAGRRAFPAARDLPALRSAVCRPASRSGRPLSLSPDPPHCSPQQPTTRP